MLQTIRRLLIRPRCFRLEQELPGGVCTRDIDAPWQSIQWNKIEDRLFSFINMNWPAKPVVSYRVIINLISATATKTGLKVVFELDSNLYSKSIVVSDEELATINIVRADFYGDWNHTIRPFNCPDGAVDLGRA